MSENSNSNDMSAASCDTTQQRNVWKFLTQALRQRKLVDMEKERLALFYASGYVQPGKYLGSLVMPDFNKAVHEENEEKTTSSEGVGSSGGCASSYDWEEYKEAVYMRKALTPPYFRPIETELYLLEEEERMDVEETAAQLVKDQVEREYQAFQRLFSDAGVDMDVSQTSSCLSSVR